MSCDLWSYETHTVSPLQHTSPKKSQVDRRGPRPASRNYASTLTTHAQVTNLFTSQLSLSLPISETRSEARPQNHHLLPFNLSHLHVRRASCTSPQVRAPDSNWRRRRRMKTLISLWIGGALSLPLHDRLLSSNSEQCQSRSLKSATWPRARPSTRSGSAWSRSEPRCSTQMVWCVGLWFPKLSMDIIIIILVFLGFEI